MTVGVHRPSFRAAGAMVAACLGACDATAVLQSGVSEPEAARSVATLHTHHIGAQRQAQQSTGQAGTTFDLHVAVGDVAKACQLISARASHAAPTAAGRSVSAFIPTPAEERAAANAATAVRLEQAIAMWDGVIDVNVQIVDAPVASVLGAAQTASRRVAVTLVHAPAKPPSTQEIRNLVEHVLPSSDGTQALVSLIEKRAVAPASLTQLGPIAVTPGSAPLLKATLATLLALSATLAALLLWALRRRR